jgi:hypothetical protein
MRCCSECGLLFNSAYDPSILNFDGQYENEQGHSSRFAAHVDESIERVVRFASGSPAPLTIIEIGCGQGTFMRKVADRLQRAVTLIGYDPVLQRIIDKPAFDEKVNMATLRLVPPSFRLLRFFI